MLCIVSNGEPRRFRSDCAFAQANQDRHCSCMPQYHCLQENADTHKKNCFILKATAVLYQDMTLCSFDSH